MSVDLRIRPARPGDAQSICAIINPTIIQTTATFTDVPRDPEQVAKQIAERPAFWRVALERDQILGFASLTQFRPGPGYAECLEHSIYVASDAMGRGIGRALMRAVIEAARSAQGVMLIAAISGTNAAAIAFHTRCGFEVVGRIPSAGKKLGRRHDLVLMQRFV